MSAADRLRELAANATPGPWSWTHHERGPWQVGTVVDEDEQPVGGYLDFTALDDQDLTLVDFICEGGESSSTDARLIAAAPDMAVLLARALDALAPHCYGGSFRCAFVPDAEPCPVCALLADADRALGAVT